MRGLKDKRVLITGGAGGIGAAAARRFLEEGSRVVILDRDARASAALARELPGLAGVLEADVSRPAEAAGAMDEFDRRWGGLDVLVNNAGLSRRGAFLDISPDEWREVMATNLDGVFFMAQQAGRRMVRAGRGAIVNMGSTNGLVGYHYYADYNASKAGVIELTRSMALELGPAVRVNAVCPGFILTPMQEAEYTADMQASFAAKVPLRRLGRPEDVAALLAFLASDEAAFITGETVVIDGGEICGGLASQA